MGIGKHRHVWVHILEGLICTAVLLAVKIAFVEPTEFGERLRLTTYDYMQHRLFQTLGTGHLPVVVVDTTGLPSADYGGKQASSRAEIKRLLDMILENHPRAVGIDIDFSPDENGWITPEDPSFFDHCVQMVRSKHVPVFLGIQRSITSPPDAWLGLPEYEELAASLVVPRQHTRAMLRSTHVHGSSKSCKTLSAALAATAESEEFEPPVMLRWAAELSAEKKPFAGLDVRQFLVDYSPLEKLETERIPYRSLLIKSDPATQLLLRDRVVILGDATRGKTTDVFLIPDRNAPYPGVFLHACAANTLIKSPLYELTFLGRIALDVLLVLLIILVTCTVSLLIPASTRRTDTSHIRSATTWAVVVVTFLGGILMVNKTRVMWDDFPLVILGLLAHQPFERVVKIIIDMFRGNRKRLTDDE